MGRYFVDFNETAKEEIAKIKKSGDKATIKKLEKIILELSNHPTSGIGIPEPLKHQLSGYWSRRLNKKDRLIYEIIEEPDTLVALIPHLMRNPNSNQNLKSCVFYIIL